MGTMLSDAELMARVQHDDPGAFAVLAQRHKPWLTRLLYHLFWNREEAEDAYGLKGSCGFTFGNGCDFGPPHSSLFGGKMGRRKLTPIRHLDT